MTKIRVLYVEDEPFLGRIVKESLESRAFDVHMVTDGLDAGKVGTTRRRDGSMQVTYNGHPLYYYVGDRNAGDTSGQGLDQFGAEWYVLAPSGNQIGD